jgi:hypothetical protein
LADLGKIVNNFFETMAVDKQLLLYLIWKRSFELPLKAVYLLSGDSEDIDDVLAVPFLGSVVLLFFLKNLLFPCLFEFLLFVKVL